MGPVIRSGGNRAFLADGVRLLSRLWRVVEFHGRFDELAPLALSFTDRLRLIGPAGVLLGVPPGTLEEPAILRLTMLECKCQISIWIRECLKCTCSQCARSKIES